MAFLFAPKESRFEQIAFDKAIELAEKVIKAEQEIRIGETGELQPDGEYAEISPMKYFVFDDMGEVYPIWGNMFGPTQEHPHLDSKAQTALVVKIFTHVLNSRVVLHITEGWSALKCHSCGAEYIKSLDMDNGICECGAEKCQPRDNPHSTEVLMCNVSRFKELDEDKRPRFGGASWIYEIVRDENHKITGFTLQNKVEDGGLSGRMTEHWILHEYEVPHLMANYPHFCDALNVECPQDRREAAKMVVDTKPKGYPLLTWGVHTEIEEVLTLAKEQHAKARAEFN